MSVTREMFDRALKETTDQSIGLTDGNPAITTICIAAMKLLRHELFEREDANELHSEDL